MHKTSRITLICLAFQLATLTAIQAQIVTHGPVVGGVTESTAQVLLRTDQAASVALRWGDGS